MIQIKNEKQIQGIREACKIVAEVHQRVDQKLKPGLSTYQIDNIVKHTLRELGAKSAFKKYRQGNKPPFPSHACISVNEEVVHGIGKHDKIINQGDIVTIDVGAEYNGFYGDAAFTTVVGQGSDPVTQLVENTKQVLIRAIEATKPGVYLFDISKILAEGAKEFGYGSVENYYGHGVGLSLHEDPEIPNYVPEPGSLFNHKLQPGMTITYEPMFTLGTGKTKELSDKWSVVTIDGSWAAHWEHTILVTESGAEILTRKE